MTIEERINRSVCRLAVLHRLFSLEGLRDAVHVGSCDKDALQAGIGEWPPTRTWSRSRTRRPR